MSNSDTTQKININKKSLTGGDDEKQLQFSVVSQLQEEGPVEVSGDEGHSNASASAQGFQGGVGVSHLQLVKLQSNVDKLESQIKLISTFASETKVLESEMKKIIKKLYQAQPKLKPYLMRMKKLLKDHTDIEKVLEIAKDKVEETTAVKSESKKKESSKKTAEVELKKKEQKNDQPDDPNFTKEMSLADLMAMQDDDVA